MAKKGQVVSFPTLRAIPAPDVPLEGVAYDKYVFLARRLMDIGKLNTKTVAICQDLAQLHQDEYRRVQRGQSVPIRNIEMRNKLMEALDLGDERHTSAAEGPKEENRFSRFGVITRTWAA